MPVEPLIECIHLGEGLMSRCADREIHDVDVGEWEHHRAAPREIGGRRECRSELDSKRVKFGLSRRLDIGYSVRDDIPNVIPFVAVCGSDRVGTHYNRWQLQLIPAFASATHKMQGSTAKYGAVILPSVGRPFARGLDYVAPLRPTELNKLFLLRRLTITNFNDKTYHPEIAEIKAEYTRLHDRYR